MSENPAVLDRFLPAWRVAARKRLLFDNRNGRSVRDLWACGITARARERLLLSGQHWEHKGTYTSDDGTETAHYERSLDVPAVRVRARLGYHHDGTARCARFWSDEAHDDAEEHALPRFAGYLDARPSARAVDVETETEPLRTMVVGHASADPERMYSTTEQDEGNLRRLVSALRTREGIPYLEDLKDFLERPYESIERHHASFALGWDGRRWLQLEQGAWPNEVEAAQLRGLRYPQHFYTELVRLMPKRYGFGAAPKDSRSWTDFSLMASSNEDGPLADARAVRNGQTGYQRYTVERLGQLANLLAYKGRPSVERLWLLLFLCDADAYWLHGQGFTGLRYRWTDAGPVAELHEERLAELCAKKIVRLDGSGAGAVVKAHPFFYPPDYGVLWAAEALEKRLPTEWMKLPHNALLGHCAARVDGARAGEWLSYDGMMKRT